MQSQQKICCLIQVMIILFTLKIMLNLTNKTAKQKAQLKSKELAKVKLSKFKKGDFNIEVIGDIKEIEVNGVNGIELFATAKKKGKQLGFGKDGSVEIERFRFYNPPVLVDDDNGDIIREWEEENPETREKEIKQRKLKYDPTEAIRQSLAHTILQVAKDEKNIIKGKIGNTTSTFYSSQLDGRVSWDQLSNNWNSAHDDDGSNAGSNYGRSPESVALVGGNNGGDWVLRRGYYLFDTSGISGTDIIDSATFSVYCASVGYIDNDAQAYIGVVQVQGNNLVADNSLSGADYDQCGDAINDPTQGAISTDLDTMVTNDYTDYTLNVTGKGWVARDGEASPSGATNGITYLGLREGHDIEDEVPDLDLYNNYESNGISTYMSEEAGTTKDPKLVVVHSASSSIKSINGLAKASIKSRNSLAIGSIKSINGLE